MAIETDSLPPPDGAPPPQTGAPLTPEQLRRRRAIAILVPLVVVAVAGILRFYNLGHPSEIYFDETYYANDAHQYLQRGVEEDFAVHPPVGKWLIATGIAIFGFDSVGWRAAAAAAGTVAVLLTYFAGLRLFRHRGIAGLAALLVAIDGLAFTMSRIAMLDIFAMTFVIAGFWLLLIDRDRQWAVADGANGAVPRIAHPYRWLAGIAFGLALASKWSGIFAIGAAGLFILVSDMAWRRRITGRLLARPVRLAATGLATLVIVPAAVYLFSYVGWFANLENTRKAERLCPAGACDAPASDVIAAWWEEQGEILQFHRNLEATHDYRSAAWTWPIILRPVAYHYESCTQEKAAEGKCLVEEGNVEHIVGIGNPAIWWLALAAYPLLAWAALGRRDWRAAAILLFLLAQYVPWLLQQRPLFLFYMVPVVPFTALALAYVGLRTLRLRWTSWIPGFLATIAVASFLFWYPVLSGLEMSKGAWNARMWLSGWV
ncbi:MAG TPA: phospholipid carrier-dependent glycosyltransferase [Egibacteraceae bacterium]|nr:phospholipid carrier-dependent glycosyltransferase [Egibacteraceae bacterium]